MKITAYELNENPLPLVPAKRDRQWMDDTIHKYAYRCLPLSIANAHGWEFLAPCDFSVMWNGGEHQNDLTFEYDDDTVYEFVSSTFGFGIVTFHTEHLIKTDEGWNTFVTGSPNYSIPWATPLSGVVETWWLDFTFTLNWRLHNPGQFWYSKGEPLGHIFPVPADYSINAVKMNIADNPEIQKSHEQWATDRREFNADSKEVFSTGNIVGDIDPDKPQTHWEKNYMRGIDKQGNKQPNHKTKVRFPEFKKDV